MYRRDDAEEWLERGGPAQDRAERPGAAGGVVFNPAAAAVLPALVDEEELVAANSALWSAAVVSQIALAPLAGALVATWGVAPAF